MVNRREKQVICALAIEAAAVILQRYADYKLQQLGMNWPVGVPAPAFYNGVKL